MSATSPDVSVERERLNIDVVSDLNDALNARDRAAVRAAFAIDGTFRPHGTARAFDGPEAATNRQFEFLDSYRSGEFRTMRTVAAGDEVFNEWRWEGVTVDGMSVQRHGVDYFRLRGGQIVVKSTYLKV
jgi:ketosteroid isomerase-like protein